MVILILENAPPGVRGELSRWMIEPRAGVFVGKVSALVRDKLWEKAKRSAPEGGGMMLYSSNTEQGFAVRSFGDTSRKLVDVEGIVLVQVPEGVEDGESGVREYKGVEEGGGI